MVEDMAQTKCLGGRLRNIMREDFRPVVSLKMMLEGWLVCLGAGCEVTMIYISCTLVLNIARSSVQNLEKIFGLVI